MTLCHCTSSHMNVHKFIYQFIIHFYKTKNYKNEIVSHMGNALDLQMFWVFFRHLKFFSSQK